MIKTTIYATILLLIALACQRVHGAEQPVADLGRQLFVRLLARDYVKARELILVAGADVNYQNDGGATSLMVAVLNGSVDMVNMLIEHGANVKAKLGPAVQKTGYTALHYLVNSSTSFYNFMAIVDALLDAGANVNAKDEQGYTPLHLAAYKDLTDRVHYLISKGANPAIKNNEGQLPVDLVSGWNRPLRDYLFSVTHMHLKKG